FCARRRIYVDGWDPSIRITAPERADRLAGLARIKPRSARTTDPLPCAVQDTRPKPHRSLRMDTRPRQHRRAVFVSRATRRYPGRVGSGEWDSSTEPHTRWEPTVWEGYVPRLNRKLA